MGPTVTVRVTSSRLRNLSDVARGELQKAIDATALAIQGRAQQNAPVLTGTLRRSIHTITGGGTGKALTALVGPSVDYGKFVEFGTRRMAARPFLIPALEAEREPFKSRIKAVLDHLR